VKRQTLIDTFNKPTSTAKIFLLSTRAAGMGINLCAATRTLVLDASWNPSHITQAVHRFYRFGQTKPTFVYRLVADGW
jgi:transcriptional regulator ATRX